MTAATPSSTPSSMPSSNWVPKDHPVLSAFLSVKDARGLADFIVGVFDARLAECMSRPDGVLAHGELRIGDSNVMLSETCEQVGLLTGAMYVYTPDVDAVFARAVEKGATPLMPPMDQFWGDRMAGVRDAWGNLWWLATHRETLTPDELNRRAAEAAAAQHAQK